MAKTNLPQEIYRRPLTNIFYTTDEKEFSPPQDTYRYSASTYDGYGEVQIFRLTNQMHIITQTGADDWDAVLEAFEGGTLEEVKATLDDMFPVRDNDDLARFVFSIVSGVPPRLVFTATPSSNSFEAQSND